MAQMTDNEIYAFLNRGTLTAKISTASLTGKPHVAPVWFVVDGGLSQSANDLVITFTTYSKSVKAKQLLSNPVVCLCVDDQEPPYTFVIINGIVDIDRSPNEEELLKFTTRIAERYMGNENAARFGKRNAVPGELIIRVRPTKIIAQKNVSE
ncbi:PPOX class F420-dependent oxidoreductase [Candidatus Nitrosocosmicus hydrocola]|uniref:PPOX class F420-dependent oxidoreductase n=1 Tax=Candidatus Nitrosocosmicus hydrocola TaxID=1826872 RepID=UPI0018C87B96|nr:PPOX class F420-dependent oxidoreductase [Candidatus Nitrosocosmicus hydrocola]